MTPQIATTLSSVIAAAESVFGIQITSLEQFHPDNLRGDVTVHSFRHADTEGELDDKTHFEIRDWFENHGWFVSRQRLRHPSVDGVEHVYIAPIEFVQLGIAYHATRTTSIPSILQYGLFPGIRDRCNTDRLDTLGNIYVARDLGYAGDEHRNEFGTAHWWREHLAKTNRYNDRNWSIIKVHLPDVAGIKCFSDIWSQTGIVIRAKSPIAARFLEPLVF